ncbi:MAG: MlaD family protein [candidate division Zixibacteria bacterium]|nr:MlaD family protein [candidate division Zixibacteria bacterium]
MRRSVKIKWGAVPVGVVIMLAIVILIYSSMTGGGTSIFDPKISFVCYFANVNGLVRGSPIWFGGVEVGNVTSLDFEVVNSPRQVRVVCRVTERIHRYLTTETRVELGTIGILGDRYIEIVPGLKGTPIESMDVIEVQEIGSAPAMFEAGEKALGKVDQLATNLDTLLVRVNRGEGTLGQLASNDSLYVQLTALLANLTRITASLQKNQESLIESVRHMSQSVGDLAQQVSENKGTLGKLVTEPALYDNLNSSSARLDSILTKIDLAKGNLGLMVNDSALYVELTNLLTRANSLITDIEKNPRKYFKFSVF